MKRKLLINLLGTVAFLFFWQAGFTQNLLTNGNMESWTDATTLDGWTVSGDVAQESTIVHSGTYSAKQVAKDKLYQDIDVVPGKTYNISLWYYVDGGDGTDARIWSAWQDNSGASLSDNSSELKGPNNKYLTSAKSWQKYEVSLKAPASAAKLHFEVRTYKPSSGSFAVYWDDFSVEVSGGSDTQAPTWSSGFPNISRTEDTHARVGVKLDEKCKVYFIVVPKGSDQPNLDQIKAGVDYGTVKVTFSDSINVTSPEVAFYETATNLTASSDYDVYLYAIDLAGNEQTSEAGLAINTTAARALTFDNPKANDTYNLGDTIKLEWTSSNIDSLIVTIRPVSSFVSVVMTDGPFAAAAGSYNLIIPKDATTGDYSLVLHDYYDTTFKQSVSPVSVVDNRTLQMTEPKDNDTVYVGDTLKIKWTSSNIDSVLIGGYISAGGPDGGGGYFMLTGDPDHFTPGSFKPVSAASGEYKFFLPADIGGSIKLDSVLIWDADDIYRNFKNPEDIHLKGYATPVYIQDTLPLRITYSMPAFGMTDFMPSSWISCDFSCDSLIRGTGNLYLKKDDGTVIQTISATDTTHLDVHGSGLSFSPNPALVPGESYYIEIDSGFVKSYADNKVYSGLTGKKWNFTVAGSSLYFSEYIEGSGNNKALEIYNPTGKDVSLDDYVIASSYNGSGLDDDKPVYHFPKGYVLKAGSVFVLANAGASQDVLKVANDTLAYNESGYVCGFNGNDARVLMKVENNGYDRMWVDAIGEPWNNPGAGWDVAGVTAATKDHTLLRKADVKIGNGGNWGISAGTDADNSQWIVKPKNYFDNLGKPTPAGNDQAEITCFKILDNSHKDVTISSKIDSKNDSIFVDVLSGTDVTKLYASMKISAGAEVHPDSTDLLDFTNPLKFTVYAENKVDSTVWVVTVSVATSASSKAMITSFVIPNSVGDARIDTTGHTVWITMPYGTDITALVPEITVSAGATISPASGVAQDFTEEVIYTVTAQDGTTTVNWTVLVDVEKVNNVGIKDIQYTTDASGDSPLVGQIVSTTGYVTALSIYKDTFKGFFMEDSVGAWHGLYVYNPVTAKAGGNPVAIGDSVVVTGTVSEYNNFTELGKIQSLKVISSGHTLPGPAIVKTGDAGKEMWESVYIKFVNATCTNADMGHGEVEVNDGSGAATLDDYLFQYDAFTLNDVYSVTGIMNYSYGAFKLDPRSADDITNVTGISNNSLADNINVYPNPGNGRLNITMNNALKGKVTVRVMDITGREVYRHVFNNVLNQTLPVNISAQPSNLYFITISDAHNTVVKKFMKR